MESFSDEDDCWRFRFWWQGFVLGFVSLAGYTSNIVCIAVIYKLRKTYVNIMHFLLSTLATVDLIFTLLYSFILVWPAVVFYAGGRQATDSCGRPWGSMPGVGRPQTCVAGRGVLCRG